MKKVIIGGAVLVGTFALTVVLVLQASAVALMTINATGGLDQRVPICDTGQVVFSHWIINQIDSVSDAPPSITVDLVGGGTAVFPLAKTTPGVVAMYDGPSPLGVTGASAQIYESWSGQFNLSNYFCGPSTPPTTTTTTTQSPPPPPPTTTTTKPGTAPTTTTTVTPGTTPPTLPPGQPIAPPPGTPQAPTGPISGTPQTVTG